MIVIDDLEMYDVEELSEKLHMSIQGARRLLTDGKLQGIKLSRKWYVSKDALKTYLTGNTATTGERQ